MLRSFFLTTLAAAALYGPARADIIYSFVTDQAGYTLTGPGSVTVNLYLQELTTGASQSFLAASGPSGGQGLAGFGVLLTRGSGTATIGSPTFSTSFGTAVGGQQQVNPNGPTQVGLSADIGTSPTGVVGTTNGLGNGNGRTVFLGSVNINATVGTSHFVLNDLFNSNGDEYGTPFKNINVFTTADQNGSITNGDPADWTGTIASGDYGFDVTVSAVPEPATVVLTGLAGVAMAVFAWRRRGGRPAVSAPVPC